MPDLAPYDGPIIADSAPASDSPPAAAPSTSDAAPATQPYSGPIIKDTEWDPAAAKLEASEKTPGTDAPAPISTVARASLPPDPQVEIQRYSEHFQQPVTDFKRINGKIIRKDPDKGIWEYVAPGAARWAASGVGPGISTVGGAAGSTLAAATSAETGPGAIPATIAGGGLGGSLADYGRQRLDNWLAPENSQAPIDWNNVAAWGAAGATIEPAGQVLGALGRLATKIPGVTKALNVAGVTTNAQLKAMVQAAQNNATTENPLGLPPAVMDELARGMQGKWDEAAQVEADAKSLGIDSMSLGQKTRSPVIQRLERWSASTPEGAERWGRLRRVQNEQQVPDAAQATFDHVAPKGNGNPIENFRGAADSVVEGAQQAQSKEAQTAYKVALDDPANPLVYSDKLKDVMSRIARIAPGALQDAENLAEARGNPFPKFFDVNEAGDPIINGNQPNWRAVDYIKQTLDGIARGADRNKGSIAKSLKGQLLDAAGENPAYDAARLNYGNSADAIDQILKGGVGAIQKMSGPDRLNMVNKMFAGGEGDLMPDDVAQARQLFMKSGKTDEWNAGLRSYLDTALDNATRRVQNGGDTGNVAGKTLDLWNTDRQRQVLRAAIGDPQKANDFGRFFDVMRNVSSMLPEGSSTGANAEMSKNSATQAVKGIRNAYGLLSGHAFVDRGMAALEDHLSKIAEPQARIKLMNFLQSPNNVQQLRSFLTNMPSQRALASSPPARDRAALQLARVMSAAGISSGAQFMNGEQ